MYRIMLVTRILYAFLLLFAVRDLADQEKINVLALGSIQLISILTELNFVNNSLKTLAPNSKNDPQKFLAYMLFPTTIVTVILTFFYASTIFGSEHVMLPLGCAVFIFLQQISKIPDICIKLKGLLRTAYTIETFSNIFQISIVVYLHEVGLLTTINVLLGMIFAQFTQFLVKSFFKSRICYQGKYIFGTGLSTRLDFFRPSIKFSAITFSTTLFVALALPIVAVSLSASDGYFLLLIFRVLTYCDQLSWSPFYATLPLIHQDFQSDAKNSHSKYFRALNQVLIYFISLSVISILVLALPYVQRLFSYQLTSIGVPLFIIMLLNRVIAMETQILFALTKVEPPYRHLMATLASGIIFATDRDYLILSIVVFTVSLINLHFTTLRLIKYQVQ